jgi:hypothetical protein
MSQWIATHLVCRRLQGGNALSQPLCAMSEVQICNIPKLSAREVAST